MIPLKVLGNRVLVKPDVNANAPVQTAAGVFIAATLAAAVTGEDATVSVHRGTVIAVGQPRHPLKHEAEMLARKLEARARGDEEVAIDAARFLRVLTRKQPSVQVGEDVLFSHDAGQNITVDGETYVLLHDGELLAIVESETAAV
mgnify:CR=1 FL=1